MFDDLKLIFLIAVIVVTTISGGIAAARMRRRAKRALGSELSDTELTSLNTWIKVEDAEERHQGGKLS